MKKLIILAILFWSFFSGQAYASNPDHNAIMEYYAKEIIHAAYFPDNTTINKTVIKYDNIDTFIKLIQHEYNKITKNELENFVSRYIGLGYEYLHLKDELSILDYNEITVSESISIDGTMQLKKYTGKKYIDTSFIYYDIWATANWLDIPKIKGLDCLSLGNNSFYDDFSEPAGCVIQYNKCSTCQDTFIRKDSTTTPNNTQVFRSSTELYFSQSFPKCTFCNRFMDCSSYIIFIKYSIIVPKNTKLKTHVAYGHLIPQNTQLTACFDYNGTPTIVSNKKIYKIYSEYNHYKKKYTSNTDERKYIFLFCLVFLVIICKKR